jgi:hypothetical protein
MATITRIEKRQRGIFGWLFLIIFWAFNALMAFGLFAGISGNVSQGAQLATEAEQAGHAIGTAIGVGMILSIWLTGALILGLLVWLTAGKKVIIETTEG